MKKFSLLALIFALFLIGCDSKIDLSPKEIKWDREICERCKMIISDRFYAAQVINPQNGKRYYYDDIGCTILWFDEAKITWEKEAVIYVTDASSGKWINAKEAYWTYGKVTPMDFGFSAYEWPQTGLENHTFDYMRDHVLGKPQ
jgi:copper chaperone NosL